MNAVTAEILILLGAIVGLFMWNRSESREDNRRILDLVTSMKDEINKEMKDFHGRLCALEEKYLQLMTKK